MKPMWIFASAAMALVLTAGAAGAQPGPAREAGGRMAGQFEAADTDNSGDLTVDEMRAHRESRFAVLDAGGDDTVSEEEFLGGLPGHGGDGGRPSQRRIFAKGLFAEMDADDSGALTKAEFLEPVEDRFAQLDRNGDARVTREEVRWRASDSMRDRAMRRQDRPPMRFDRLDRDGNGRVTRSEFQDHTRSMFERMDSDGDGVLSEDEVGRHHGGKGSLRR